MDTTCGNSLGTPQDDRWSVHLLGAKCPHSKPVVAYNIWEILCLRSTILAGVFWPERMKVPLNIEFAKTRKCVCSCLDKVLVESWTQGNYMIETI